MKSFFLKHFAFQASWLLTHVPSQWLMKLGERKALKAFKEARKLSAYQQFLSSQPEAVQKVNSIEEFKKIPICDKDSYIKKFKLKERTVSEFPFMFYKSSGYSGNPVYWTQCASEYGDFKVYVEFNLKLMKKIHKRKTLIISLYALSSWITGQQLLSALYYTASRNETVTIFNCGMNPHEAYDLISKYGQDYEQVLIFSYPLTLKELLESSSEHSIDWPSYNISVFVGAEGITYNWAQYINKILNPPHEFQHRVFSAYGAADTGISVAAERLSGLLIKDAMQQKKGLLVEMTGEEDMPLHVFQYNPLEYFLEEVENELVITKYKHIPLIRYNLHDKAKVISYDEMQTVLSKYNVGYSRIMKEMDQDDIRLPFLLIYGRSDDTIILNGANIYINSFKDALHDSQISHLHTGKFRVEKFEDNDLFHNYRVLIELNADVKPNQERKQLYRRVITQFLINNDPGYRSAYHVP